jgi:site-specific DNA-methyltransferase (adenine-specific)
MNDPAYLAQLAIDSKLRTANAEALGRFPANLIHDGSDELLAAFPDAGGQQGDLSNRAACRQSPNGIFGGMRPALDYPARIESDKSAARFFYCAKASKSDRGEGNTHPTVKPQALMRYLVRLVTPPGGVVLDSFAGSGSTGVAAHAEGFQSILVEQCADNFNTCCMRVGMAVMS